jgi:hypothetical protein
MAAAIATAEPPNMNLRMEMLTETSLNLKTFSLSGFLLPVIPALGRRRDAAREPI